LTNFKLPVDQDDEESHQEEDSEVEEEEDEASQKHNEDKKPIPSTLEGTYDGHCLGTFFKRQPYFKHPYAMMAMVCSPITVIMQHVNENLTPKDKKIITNFIFKLHLKTMPTREEQLREMAQIEKIFWQHHRQFSNKLGIYSEPHIWMSSDVEDRPDHWHGLYLHQQAGVFGLVASHVCSKPLGGGEAEIKWGDVKDLKNHGRSKLGARSTEMQATLCGGYCVERAKLRKK
jgi:hypothetical protein